MAVLYFDTSALVKLYVKEPGSDRLIDRAGDPREQTFAIVDLARVELRAAIRRRRREGGISAKTADSLISRIEQDLKNYFLVQPVTAALIEEAIALIDRHPLRAYDALQLAGCLMAARAAPAGPTVFLCADRRLLNAARGESLDVFDPTEAP